MQIKNITSLAQLPKMDRPLSLAIGNFDGVHLGHRALVESLKIKANQIQSKSAVMCFDPQPLEFFLKDKAPKRIYSTQDKINALNQLDIDEIIVMAFDDAFANLSPEHFYQLLVDLNVVCVFLGKDFRFGKDRQGDVDWLKAYADQSSHCIEINILEDVKLIDSKLDNEQNAQRISSTSIRKLLANADFESANSCLGSAYSIEGKVVQGAQLGRQIGFPTANIQLDRPSAAFTGVYLVQAIVLTADDAQNVSKYAVANYGYKPTVDGKQLSLEVHLFNCDADLYGARIRVVFLEKIRDERAFDGIEALKAQIEKDVVKAKTVLQKLNH